MDSGLFELLAGVLVLLVLVVASYKLGSRAEHKRWIPKFSVAPHPEPAADHTHNWSPSAYLYDPASGVWLHTCLYRHCHESLRSSKGPTLD